MASGMEGGIVMPTKAELNQVVREIQALLGQQDGDVGELPQIIRELLEAVVRNPCIVAFAFDPASGQLRQVATSTVPQIPEAYSAIAQVTMRVSQQFQEVALEVAKNAHSTKTDVVEDSGPHRDDELRDGQNRRETRLRGAPPGRDGERPGLGKEAPVDSDSSDTGE